VTERELEADSADAPGPPFCADAGLAPIKTRAVQIWESCAHEVRARRSRRGRHRRWSPCCARWPAVSGTGTRRRSAHDSRC